MATFGGSLQRAMATEPCPSGYFQNLLEGALPTAARISRASAIRGSTDPTPHEHAQSVVSVPNAIIPLVKLINVPVSHDSRPLLAIILGTW